MRLFVRISSLLNIAITLIASKSNTRTARSTEIKGVKLKNISSHNLTLGPEFVEMQNNELAARESPTNAARINRCDRII